MLRGSAHIEEPSRRPRRPREVAVAWLRPLALLPIATVIGALAGWWSVVPVAIVGAVSVGIGVLVAAGTRDRPNCG